LMSSDEDSAGASTSMISDVQGLKEILI
jgi:hypothetical protein